MLCFKNRCANCLIIAGIRFNSPDDLYTFVKENTDLCDTKHKYMCSICGKSGRDRGDVRNHAENIHFPDVFTYTCELCQAELKSKVALLNHKTMKHKPKRY